MSAAKKKDAAEKCPSCGACKECGAHPQIVPMPYPVYPWGYPQPQPYRPYIQPSQPYMPWINRPYTTGDSSSTQPSGHTQTWNFA